MTFSKLYAVWCTRDADPRLPLCKCPELKINRKQSSNAEQKARSPFRWFLCVFIAFIWGFRPFHGRNKDIRTCYNSHPPTHHRPAVHVVFFGLLCSRGLPRATLPLEILFWICCKFEQIWMILAHEAAK